MLKLIVSLRTGEFPDDTCHFWQSANALEAFANYYNVTRGASGAMSHVSAVVPAIFENTLNKMSSQYFQGPPVYFDDQV
jgi:hypothetical protein